MWLIRKDIADAMHQARVQGLNPPAAAAEAFERRHIEAAASGTPRIFKLAGDVAEIMIEGVLSPKPDIWAYWFGGGNTTYPEIIQSLALASADPAIKRVVLNVNSPGGYTSGLFDVLAALESFSKPKETRASMADSAAYAIAAMGGKITAHNPASEFGSIGVCATYVQYDFEKIYEITSTDAPNKRPDPSTPEGQAEIRKYLDAIHDLFVDAIARGRGTTKDDVNANFGRGSVMLANEAKRLGMIDKIARPVLRAVTAEPQGKGTDDESSAAAAEPKVAQVGDLIRVTSVPTAPQSNAAADVGGAAKRRKVKMTEEELRAQHPDLYSAVFNKGKAEGEKGKDDAVKAALAEEKDRVEAHLVMGETCDAMKLAVESVRSGAKMTQTLSAKYMAAGMNKRDRDDRARDDAAAASATENVAGKKESAKSKVEAVADAIERHWTGASA